MTWKTCLEVGWEFACRKTDCVGPHRQLQDFFTDSEGSYRGFEAATCHSLSEPSFTDWLLWENARGSGKNQETGRLVKCSFKKSREEMMVTWTKAQQKWWEVIRSGYILKIHPRECSDGLDGMWEKQGNEVWPKEWEEWSAHQQTWGKTSCGLAFRLGLIIRSA